MRTRTWLLLAVGAGLVGCSNSEGPRPSLPPGVGGIEQMAGSPRCSDLGLGTSARTILAPGNGTYVLDNAVGRPHSVTITTSDGRYLDWSSSLGIDAVIVKGGPDAQVYRYDPESTSGTGLSAPMDAATATPFQVGYLDFCFDYELDVTQTAGTSFSRTYAWSLAKTSPLSSVYLGTSEILGVPYAVAVAVTGQTDADWATGGTVRIHNPAPFAARIGSISATLDGAPIGLDCGKWLTGDLGAGQTLVCTYAAPLAGPSTVVSVVEVETIGAVGPGSSTEVVDFEKALMTEIDRCIDVTDDRAGGLGHACADTTFAYTLPVGPYATCGATDEFVNTASFTGADTGTGSSDAWCLDVTVAPCERGCTLTQGYWKTHSAYGPAPSDATWLLLPAGPDTVFFLSGASYRDVLTTPSSAGPYYTLARQYIGAELNHLSGASLAAVDTTFADARALLQAYTPAALDALAPDSSLVVRALDDATALDAYNSGLTGPGHCSE